MTKTTASLLLATFLVGQATAARTWTDNTGKHKREADLIMADGEHVVLKNPKGKRVRVPIRRLSAADRQYVQRWLKRQKGEEQKASRLESNRRGAQKAKVNGEVGELAGQLFGKPFKVKFTEFRNGTLSFQSEEGMFSNQSVAIVLFLNSADELKGKRVRVTPKMGYGGPHVRMSQNEDDRHKSQTVMKGYAMSIDFADSTADQIVGRIRLLVPEHNTALQGSFSCKKPLDPLARPTDQQVPYVVGKIATAKGNDTQFSAAYIGLTSNGKWVSNLAGTRFSGGSGWASSTTYEPRVTTIFETEARGFGFQHVKLEPGEYFFYLVRESSYLIASG